MINQATAEALIISAKDRVDWDAVQQTARLLRASGRFGSEADEVVADVLAAFHVVQHGAHVSDLLL